MAWYVSYQTSNGDIELTGPFFTEEEAILNKRIVEDECNGVSRIKVIVGVEIMDKQSPARRSHSSGPAARRANLHN